MDFTNIIFKFDLVESTTWFYLSSFIALALFIKFGRLFSVRNLDVVLLVLITPGYLLLSHGLFEGFQEFVWLGYVWLWGMGGIFMLRMLFDCTMVRRPLLEPNLSSGGLGFLVIAMFSLLVTNIMLVGQEPENMAPEQTEIIQDSAGYRPLEEFKPLPVVFWSAPYDDYKGETTHQSKYSAAGISTTFHQWVLLAIHLAIVMGLVTVGAVHFENYRIGLGAATLYLLIPYVHELAGRIDHILPGMLLLWTIVAYQRPSIAGFFLGLAFCCYYPFHLLPLWLSFYWRRGMGKFLIGVIAGWAVLVGWLYFTSAGMDDFLLQLRRMHGLVWPGTESEVFHGVWGMGWAPQYRVPLMTAFMVMAITLSMWPAQKNLGTLISCTAAIMLASRFWNGHGGGLYLGWSLPLIILVIFRPNLEDRLTAAGQANTA